MLSLLLLSDIHFSKRPLGSPHEQDERLRHGLEKDAQAVAEQIGGVSAILICGDVAFSGSPAQYAKAASWLRDVAAKLGVDAESIWVIPGNHDIDREKTKSPLQRNLRSGLRLLEGADRDAELERLLGDPTRGPALLEALQAYNEFAARFGCEISPEQPFWEASLELTDVYRVSLHGMTSPLVSDEHDNQAEDRLVIGNMQVNAILPEDGELHVTLCHHPYSWLHDADEIGVILNGLAVLQVTGHEHRHNLSETEAGWHLEAGALQPSRRERPWEPRYNFITLNVCGDDQPRLVLRVYPRVWNQLAFGPDPAYQNEYAENQGEYVERRVNLQVVAATPPAAPRALMRLEDPRRRLLHRIALLPLGDRFLVAKRLGLPLAPFAELPAHLIPRAVLEEAEEKHLLAALWSLVEEFHGSQEGPANPFEDP